MAEENMQEVQIRNEKNGKITFNNDVIATIAGLPVVEINIHVQGVELEKKEEAATEAATAEQAPRVR